MKINFKIDYATTWGQTLCICGSIPELGSWDESKALEMNCVDFSKWQTQLTKKDIANLEYYYFVKNKDGTTIKEWGDARCIQLDKSKDFYIVDIWQNVPQQEFLYTSAFTDSFFTQKKGKSKLIYFPQTILIKVKCPFVEKGQELIMTGASDLLGNWVVSKAPRLLAMGNGVWQILLDASLVKIPSEYKLAIYDKSSKKIVHWEQGNNRSLIPLSSAMKNNVVTIQSLDYHYGWMHWKASGVAIPVFSLRTNDSFGVGEFSDLKKMVDWAALTGQKIIQTLPINDTTITHTWTDSYPYNAISIYALHPLYLGLKEFPLKDKKRYEKYQKEAQTLNNLPELDYDKVLALKWSYFKDLYNEIGTETLADKKFDAFYKANEDWLFPYACFSYFRDKYHTANYSKWAEFNKYDESLFKALIASDSKVKAEVDLLYFIQYLLHIQLLSVKEYAHSKGVILKGDIPIGISRDSVDAWVEPHLFNLDTQTGAPPDDFSVYGQNWGFPTYNWEEMAKDGYQWWTKRFRKMSDYFDAYRIDHILGFFRIWEIPLDSVQGLLGYFSPALPFTADDVRNSGMWFDEYRMTNPYIHEHFLGEFFGEYAQEVISEYLNPISWQRYELKEFCNSQIKIKALFEGKNDSRSNKLRDGLYALCNEVLFVRDKREPHKFHPRITAQYTYSFRDLDNVAKDAFNRLYDHFFYNRHSSFWRDQAMRKLPALVSSTRMLVCGEDLGMIPDCVPSVMNELQILSLEIQRMPKETNKLFENLNTIPYRSVCTTSTHDMAPIRTWWKENREATQRFYNDILWKPGAAPEECTPELCWQILISHLHAPAMLTILPLQDWLSMNSKYRRPNPDEERINIPAISQHYWRYRMHINVEDLIEASDLNEQIKSMIKESFRSEA